MKKIRKRKFAVIDLETTGLVARDGAEPFAYCACDSDYNMTIVRGDHMRNSLQDFLDDYTVEKIAHSCKFEISMLKWNGYRIPEKTIWHDTMLLHQMLRNLHPAHGLDDLTDEYFPDYKIHHSSGIYDYKEIDLLVDKQAKSRNKRWDYVDEDLMEIYQQSDGERTMLLFQLLYPIMISKGMERSYIYEVKTVIPTLAMEDFGLLVNKEESEKLLTSLEEDFEILSQSVRDEYGEYINLNSEPQLNRLLYHKLGLPILKYTGKGAPSTDKDTIFALLEQYSDLDILKKIVKWRSLVNGIASVRSYLELADTNMIIHPTINSNKARTGRQSSSNPNLQNVAKEKSLKNLYPIPARRCFYARSKRRLWAADYKGIELRLIIIRSNCEAMRQVLLNGGDPHVIATLIFYGITEDYVITIDRGLRNERKIKLDKSAFKVYRGSGKNAHFALPYGAKPEVVAKTLNWPLDRTLEGLAVYESKYPEIYHFSHTMLKKVKKTGCVITPFGRILRVPLDNLHSAADYDIQGTAAEILKRGEVNVHEFLVNDLNNEVHMALPVHDELLFDAPDYPLWEKRQVVDAISKRLTTMPEISVPLETEWKESDTSWADAKEMTFN